MKLNNRGFAISSVMYSLLILAVSLMFGIIAILVSRKMTMDKIKDEVKEVVNGNIPSVSERYKGLSNQIYLKGAQVKYANLDWYVIDDSGQEVTLVLDNKIGTTGNTYNDLKLALDDFISSNPILNIAKKNGYLALMSFDDKIDYIRPLTLFDIYAGGPIPEYLSKEKSIIDNCSFCTANYSSYLYDQKDEKTYLIAYDSNNKVNYLSLTDGAGNVRPVITVFKNKE